jgi:hypothetical protein
MSEIKMPSDDVARLINTKAVADRTVHPAEPAPTVHPVKSHEEAPGAAPSTPRRRQQRRQGERRRKGQPVLLDTRSGGDRRGGNLTDDDAADEENQERKGPGIDVYV